MNVVYVILIETAIILLGGYLSIKIIQGKNKTISSLQSDIEKEKRVSQALQDHVDRKMETIVELEPIKEQVREAKSDKEVMDAIFNIININNTHVLHNDAVSKG